MFICDYIPVHGQRRDSVYMEELWAGNSEHMSCVLKNEFKLISSTACMFIVRVDQGRER